MITGRKAALARYYRKNWLKLKMKRMEKDPQIVLDYQREWRKKNRIKVNNYSKNYRLKQKTIGGKNGEQNNDISG